MPNPLTGHDFSTRTATLPRHNELPEAAIRVVVRQPGFVQRMVMEILVSAKVELSEFGNQP